jgi:hypothetical protein
MLDRFSSPFAKNGIKLWRSLEMPDSGKTHFGSSKKA